MKLDAIRQAKGGKNNRKEKGELFVSIALAKTTDEKYRADNQPQEHLKQVKYLSYVHVFKVYSNRRSLKPLCSSSFLAASMPVISIIVTSSTRNIFAPPRGQPTICLSPLPIAV
jgi:hypothetical protein